MSCRYLLGHHQDWKTCLLQRCRVEPVVSISIQLCSVLCGRDVYSFSLTPNKLPARNDLHQEPLRFFHPPPLVTRFHAADRSLPFILIQLTARMLFAINSINSFHLCAVSDIERRISSNMQMSEAENQTDDVPREQTSSSKKTGRLPPDEGIPTSFEIECKECRHPLAVLHQCYYTSASFQRIERRPDDTLSW